MEQNIPTKMKNSVQTIERMNAILELVGQKPLGISVSELSSVLGLPKGTVHRLLSSLAYFGYIRQDTHGKNYYLGLKLLDLGTLAASQIDLRRAADPLLRHLADQCRETVHLVIMDRDEVVYIEKVESPQDLGGLRMTSRVGLRNPAHSCAVGKVLLAYFSETELAAFVSRKGLPQRTARTITDYSTLRESLRTVKAQGYAVDDEENEEGIRCLAAPVLDKTGRPVAAVSLSGPAFRVTKRKVQGILKKSILETAAKISQELGYLEAP